MFGHPVRCFTSHRPRFAPVDYWIQRKVRTISAFKSFAIPTFFFSFSAFAWYLLQDRYRTYKGFQPFGVYIAGIRALEEPTRDSIIFEWSPNYFGSPQDLLESKEPHPYDHDGRGLLAERRRKQIPARKKPWSTRASTTTHRSTSLASQRLLTYFPPYLLSYYHPLITPLTNLFYSTFLRGRSSWS